MSNVLFKTTTSTLFAQVVREFDESMLPIMPVNNDSGLNVPLVAGIIGGCLALLVIFWVVKRFRAR